MHHLCSGSRRHSLVSKGFRTCQALVRFFALHRIKPHAPPLVRTPANSFEFQSCDRTYQVGYLMLSLRHQQYIADVEYPSFRAWTTRVSNPVCSPRFRASVSETFQSAAFATGLPPDLYAFHRYTGNSALLSHPLAEQSPLHFPG